MATTNDTKRVPIQTPLMDENGHLTRPWVLFLQGLIPDPSSTSTSTSRSRISFLDYIPKRLHASIKARTCEEPLQAYMQAALDALREMGGGMIDLPGGTYPLGDAGLQVIERTTIVGEGNINSLITYSGDGAAVMIGDDTQLRDRVSFRDFGITLKDAGPNARGIAMYSTLIVALRDVAIETNQPFVALDDDEFHSSFDQVGLLLHGGTWGSLRGLVSISGNTLTWVAGDKFGPWFLPGRVLFFNGATWVVESYIDEEHITITAEPGDSAEVEYTSFLHGFNAFFSWHDCTIRGLFKCGLRATGRNGWGTGSSNIQGGAIIWNYSVSPPAGYGYYGFHLESGTFLAQILNIENTDVCMRADDTIELIVPRYEGYRSKALYLTQAGPPNCTIDGEHIYAVYCTGTFLQVQNTGAVPPFDESYIGKSVIVEKAGPGYSDLETTITAINSNGIECTLADAATYYALQDRLGGGGTRIVSGGAYSAQGGQMLDDETGRKFASVMTNLDPDFVQNNLRNRTMFHGHTDIVGNYTLTFTETGGSTNIQWREIDAVTAQLGVFGDKRLNLYAGLLRCRECGATVTEGDSTIQLTVYPGQVSAVEPSSDDIGKQISVERALDGRKALLTTITGVTATPSTWTQGHINITTTTVYDANGNAVESTLLEGADTNWSIALDGKDITINGDTYRFVYSNPDRGFIDQTTPYPGSDEIGASYAIAYNEYELTLADTPGADVTDAAVRFGDVEDDWESERWKDIVLRAMGRVRMQVGGIEKLAVDANGVAIYGAVRIYGNAGLSWSTLGGSAGLNWNKPDPDGGNPLNYGAVVNNSAYLNIRAGESRVDHDLIIEVRHEDSEIIFRVDEETKLSINSEGVQGLVSLAVTGNNSFSNLTASQWVKIANDTTPLLIFRNTHATTRSNGIDMGWAGERQWFVGTGVPSSGIEALSITEYDDGVFDAVRWMLHKGGNITIGSTTDDGANKLQVTGNVKITGNFQVTGTLPSLFIEGATPFVQTRNSSSSKVGGLDLGWGGYRQWLFSAGVPSSGSTAFALTEYTDDVYQDVRWMIFKGGNMVVGATTDDGANKLQIHGNAKVFGSLSVTDPATTRTNLGVDAAPTVTPGSVTLLKLTGGGANGSLTISATGRVTAYTAPT